MGSLWKVNTRSICDHNIFQKDPNHNPWWVKSLDVEQLQQVVGSQICSLMEEIGSIHPHVHKRLQCNRDLQQHEFHTQFISKESLWHKPALLSEGIRFESHFSKPNISSMHSVLDKLGSTCLPIWLTKFDITKQNSVSTWNRYCVKHYLIK